MTKVQTMINLVLKAVAVGMAVSSLVLLALDVTTIETSLMMLSIGLACLAVAALSETESRAAEID